MPFSMDWLTGERFWPTNQEKIFDGLLGNGFLIL